MARSASTAVLLILASLVIGLMAVPARGADPGSGTVSPTSLSVEWTGQEYAVAATTAPEECPPALDPANALCDHFFLTIDVAQDFWEQNTGQVTIRIEWGSTDNDFDLYVFGPDGSFVDQSASGGTTIEEVALLAPAPGTYEARVVPFLVIDSGYAGRAELLFTPGGPAPNPVHPSGGIAFAPSVVVDAQRTEGEPIIHVDQDGNLWESGPWGTSTQQSFLHKSTDNGDSYHIVSPVEARPDPPPGGGDTDIVTDDQGFAYFVDLEALVNLGCAVSNDGGNTWRKNPLCVESTGVDRQWFAMDKGPTTSADDNTIFLAFRQVPLGVQVFSSPGSTGPMDPIGGIVYQNAADRTFVAPDATCGQPRFDPDSRNLYLVCARGDHVEIIRGHVEPSQRTGIHFDRLALPTSPGGIVGDIFPGMAIDAAGNVYAVWIDENDHNVYMSASADRGDTWSEPLHVNGDPANTNVWVWAAAGSRGIVDLVWYGTAVRGDPDAFPSWFNSRQAAGEIPWFPYFAQVHFDFADPAGSTIYQVRASEHPNHFGQICQGGIGCTLTNGDRTMADFLAVAIDHTGAARIVYDDTTNQHHGAAVFEARQIAGPGAFGKRIRGTAPTNPMADPAGDAQFPHYFPDTGPGPNHPAMDFTRAGVSQPDAATLRIVMTVADASDLTPPTGAESILWLTRWQSAAPGDGGEPSFRFFYAGAKSVAGGTPTFFSGTGTSANDAGVPGNGCVTSTPRLCKIFLYPEEKAQGGTFDRRKGTITVDVPLADIGRPASGDRLLSVTAFSFGEIGEELFQDVDGTRAFDFVVGGEKAPPPRKVTGSGAIATDDSGGEGLFNLLAHTDNRGKVDYVDDASGLTFASAFICSVSVEGTKATIEGTGFVDGTFTTFVVVVEDLSESGAGSDTFSITLGTGYERSGVLLRGNVQIH